jgi:glutamate carboxypeptidase
MEFSHYFKSRQGDIIRLLKYLVNLESPSHDKDAVNKCSLFCAEELKKTGATIKQIPQKDIGDFYTAEYKGVKKETRSKPILVLTHSDTVWPVGRIETMPFYVEGQKIFGPGVLDMKAGLAMLIFVLRTFKQLNISPQKNISIFINSSEEIGNRNATNMLKKMGKTAFCALCLEPAIPGGALKMQRKGRLVVKLEATGKAAHAGNPDLGVNAIEELTKQLQNIHRLKTKNVSVNVGVIEGGTKPNVVAEKAWSLIDIRFWENSQKDKVWSFLTGLTPHFKGAKVKAFLESFTPPMVKTPASAHLFNHVKSFAETLGIALESGRTGGGSDASVVSSMGVPTLDGLGPDGDGIHAKNEHLLLPSLLERTTLLAEILRQL